MGGGLQRVAKQMGGLIVTDGAATVVYKANVQRKMKGKQTRLKANDSFELYRRKRGPIHAAIDKTGVTFCGAMLDKEESNAKGIHYEGWAFIWRNWQLMKGGSQEAKVGRPANELITCKRCLAIFEGERQLAQ